MTAPQPPRVITVLAAVIEVEGRFLVTRRLAGTHLAGLWEFPGGKCEPDETHEACLARELREELGVDSLIGREVMVIDYAYPDRIVRLHFRRCALRGTPQPMLGQAMRWIAKSELDAREFPPADAELISRLQAGDDDSTA